MSESSARQRRRDAVVNRERVLDAATELIRRRGEKVPMADIASLAGVGVGTVYRHFATRDDLVRALVFRSFQGALENARAAAAVRGSALDGIRAFLAASLRDRERLALPLNGGPVLFDAGIREVQAQIRGVLQVVLDRGQSTGEIRGDLVPEDVIVASALLTRGLPAVDDWDVRGTRQIELLLNGLRAG